ncbi:MAG: Uncharacterized protein FD143_2276 [Ignavibacteria bacterium]|nr:MAG: Uncharacterized protein FD143_2276 [Ignavibacteria bacterium]KAF0159562.1 MAG: Uncharacterized protein FD188_2163 [Ignavibacteria bacterium]
MINKIEKCFMQKNFRELLTKYWLLIICMFCYSHAEVFSQIITAEKISTTEGLSSPNTRQVFQDSYGLIWVCTPDGLNMYNGYKMKIYKNDPDDSSSILSNNIWRLVEDKERNLWIATEDGVSKYLRKENKFINYKTSSIVKHAMVQSRINYIYVDSKDNVWATLTETKIWKFNRGMNKWEIMKFDSEDNALVNAAAKVTYPITEDKNGVVWVGSLNHPLSFYDVKENVFKKAEIKNSLTAPIFSALGNETTNLYFDRKNILWITTRRGIYKYNPLSRVIKTIEEYSTGQLTFSAYYNSITEDEKGNLWIANNFRGLLKFDGISNKYTRVKLKVEQSFPDVKKNLVVTNVYEDNSGMIWISTLTQGILKYNPDVQPFNLYLHDEQNKETISSSSVLSILESHKYSGKIYVGTAFGGLNVFNSTSKTFSQIPYKVINDINKGSVSSLFEESDGSLWVGTFADGLLKMNSSYNVTERYLKDPNNNASLSGDLIKVIKKDRFGNLWVGTTSGLNLIDGKSKKVTRISDGTSSVYPSALISILSKKNINNNVVSEIKNVGNRQKLSKKFSITTPGEYLVVSVGEGALQDSIMVDYGWIENSTSKIIWTSSGLQNSYHIGGHIKNRIIVDIINLTPGEYSLKYVSDQSHSYNNWNMEPPIEKELWGIKLMKIDDKKKLSAINELVKEASETRLVQGKNINSIHFSSNDIMWIGSEESGLDKVNLRTKESKNYTYKFNDPNSLNNKSVKYIYEDANGVLWIATNGGINKFNPITEKFEFFTETDGLPSNYISAILPGNKGELWLSTQAGISRMSVNKSNEKANFVNYDLGDGLGGLNFLSTIALKSHEGKFYFGGEHGLNEFSPFVLNKVVPALVFTDLKISNKSIAVMDKEFLLNASIIDLKEITLPYTQNDISFEFSALHFAKPSKNQYAHKLIGYDDEWIYDNNRFATYTNLDPGEYVFVFKGSNKDGVWNENGKSIKITITPPWWLTYWAYFGYSLIFIGSVFIVDRVQRKRLLSKEKEKQKRLDIEHKIEAAELKAKAIDAENKLLQVEYESKKKELEEARQLQLSMLPKEVPNLPHLEIAVYMKTATEVGGDYYDFNVGSDGTLTVVVGDATGHGMKAGIIVTATKSLFSSHSENPEILSTFGAISRCIRQMNMKRLSMCLSMLKIKEYSIQISSAGMPPVLLFRNSTRKVEEIFIKGMPLGSFHKYPYELQKIDIKAGDTLLMMSDGYPEMFNKDELMLGYDKTIEIFEKIAHLAPKEIINSLNIKGAEWLNGFAQSDDITFVVIKAKQDAVD